MDQPLNCEHVTMTSDQQPKPRETALGVLENSAARAEIVIPSSATWSEGVSPCVGSWVGY